MDLKAYYQKLRKAEQDIEDAHLVVVSQETPDGGKAGLKTEVSRAIAAMMIVEGRARLATKEETAQHQKAVAEARRLAEQVMLSGKVQLNVISEGDIRAIRGALRQDK
jgi:hypothetical protein